VDFYDVKGDIEALTAAFGGGTSDYRFVAGSHPALHPGRTAQLLRSDAVVGVIGELHPQLVADLGLPSAAIVFELDWAMLGTACLPRLAARSEFPASRRDIAVVVAESVSIGAMSDSILSCGLKTLVDLKVFDVYRGKGLDQDCKSVAFGLIFQDLSRTLNLEEVDAAVLTIVQKLQNEHGAVLRN
jgi:phenylalanyl-tRNA synthetase beta chain